MVKRVFLTASGLNLKEYYSLRLEVIKAMIEVILKGLFGLTETNFHGKTQMNIHFSMFGLMENY